MRSPHHVIRQLPSTAHSFPFLGGAEPGPSSAGSFLQWSLGGEDVAEPRRQTDSPDSSDSSTTNPGTRDDIPAATEVAVTSHELRDSRPIISGGTKRDARSGPRHPPPSATPRYYILPSLRLPIVPRPLPTPLSFFPPENFQVTEAASGNLEMSLYEFLVMLLTPRLI